MEILFKHTIESPVGYLEITSDQTTLLSISFVKENTQTSIIQPHIVEETVKQLKEYFQGVRKKFELKLNPEGTDFQKKVWTEVEKIPFGKTASYHDIGLQTGSAKNSRAVGLANGKNPIPIIIPCHRIIGKNGKLTGYAGGLDIKSWLLLHELNHSEYKNLLF